MNRRTSSIPTGKPIGPVGLGDGGKFLLGADGRLGRDEMVRLMYGGRTSLFIGVMAAVITTILAVALGLIAGYYRGWADAVISRTMDVIWAFPVLLLGIALGTALAASGGLKHRPHRPSSSSSIWIPILIIGFVYMPYMARPIRGEVLALREKEFVEAAVAQGAGSLRIMFTRAPAQPVVDDHRLLHPQHRQQHAARGGAVLPRRRRAAADILLGHDGLRRARS